jgi:serine/threonine-protein kinase
VPTPPSADHPFETAREGTPPAHASEIDPPMSSVRPSAPTLQEGGLPPRQKVVVRTPVPPRLEGGAPFSIERMPGRANAREDEGAEASGGSLPAGELRSVTAPTGLAPGASSPSSRPSSRPGSGGVGATLGRYELLEELGHGGMATVYRALDPRLERYVALKVIHHHLRESAEIAERFRHEALAVAKLKHRSIVEIYDVPDSESGERFLVAELVEGPSLRKFLQGAKGAGRPPHLPPEIAAALVLQIADALSRAHEQGIIHRDVKPENILLAGLGPPSSGRGTGASSSPKSGPPPLAKLTDFGIAKILDAQGMTSTGQILGSPAHMSPEQIEAGEITPRVDVFATGVLFYELLTGRLPFDGKNPAQVIRRVLDGQFTPPDRVEPTVGGRWSAIVARLLARDPAQRPADARGVCDEIRRELDALGISDPDRELADYLREPEAVDAGWGTRLKPRLVARAIEAREKGDVVGAAHDLNRALAYDPADPKLVRSVTSLRTRERWIRTARAGVPIALVAIGVSVLGFAIVRRMRTHPTPGPDPSGSTLAKDPKLGPSASSPLASQRPIGTGTASALASTTPSTSAAPSTSAVPSIALSAAPSTAPSLVLAPSSSAPSANGKKTRKVRFNVFPPGRFTVDGAGPFDMMDYGERELAIGDHAITATGNGNCCFEFKGSRPVVAGEGTQKIDVQLALQPAKVFVSDAPAGATVSLSITYGDGKSCSGAPPVSCAMFDTSAQATITVRASDFPAKTRTATLIPGNPTFVKFAD